MSQATYNRTSGIYDALLTLFSFQGTLSFTQRTSLRQWKFKKDVLHVRSELIDSHQSDFASRLVFLGSLLMVRETGIEPARLTALDPKSSASASSATPASLDLLLYQMASLMST